MARSRSSSATAFRQLCGLLQTVQAFKEQIGKHGGAPKTINRRISSLSSFNWFLSGAAAGLRLPITVPNQAHEQFIARETSDPVEETRALSETRARQLMAMGTGEALIDIRDRAILKFYLYTGARIETGCALNVSDFHQDGDEATLRFHLKGNRAKTKDIHFAAADAVAEYIKAAGIESGPLFRPRRSPQSTMYRCGWAICSACPARCRKRNWRPGRRFRSASIRRTRCARDGDIAARCQRLELVR